MLQFDGVFRKRDESLFGQKDIVIDRDLGGDFLAGG
jgi:hypothetical protein